MVFGSGSGHTLQIYSGTYTYDAENRLTGTAGYTYVYDGDGQRVKKSSGSTGTLYWTGSSSVAIAESNLTGTFQEEYVFFNGKRAARRDVSGGAVHYYFSDHLGSHAVVTNAAGTTCEQDIDYYPYGGVQHDYCSGPTQNYKFSGKERDSESGLDNFEARYNSSALGRFMTPDWAARPATVPYAVFGDPQSLNLYSYVRNNSINNTDPSGHCGTFTQWGEIQSVCERQEQQQNQAQFEALLEEKKNKAAQKPLTAKQIQKQFYKQHGKAFNTAVKRVFGKDASKVGTQTLANAPHLDTTKNRADLHKMGKRESAEARNRPDFSDPNRPSLAQNGTIFIPSETVDSGNMNAIAGDYAHELANLLDFQINRYNGPVGTEQNYVTPDIKNDYPDDADTGMTVEVTMFGKPQF